MIKRRVLIGMTSLLLVLCLTAAMRIHNRGIEPTQSINAVFPLGDLGGLAIGVPREDIGAIGNAGGVNILFSPPGGLSTADSQWFDQDTGTLIGVAEAGNEFARALSVGDFNGDGYVDLAVGVPYEDIGTTLYAGGINVIYGSADGFTDVGNQWFDQSTTGIYGVPQQGDIFGFALAAGNFDSDEYDDLAVGVPGEDGAEENSGGVTILYGSSGGLTTTGSLWLDQDTPDVLDSAEAQDEFGKALAIGDLNHDGYDDLAIGVPGEDVGSVNGAGGVNVLFGSSAGLTASGSQWFDQDSPGILEAAETSDSFGLALAVGDIDGDGYEDLVVAAPYETVGGEAYAGGVHVLYGSAAGLTDTNNQWFDQDNVNVIGYAGEDDRFGDALSMADVDGNGYLDLVVGVPGEYLYRGGIHVFYGTAGGLTAVASQWFDQDTPGIAGAAENNDGYGFALASGYLNGDRFADVVVGVPGEDLGTEADAGGVNILYGSAAGLSAAGSQWFDQDTPGMMDSVEQDDDFGRCLAVWSASKDWLFLPLILR
jgi:hypothetical protein